MSRPGRSRRYLPLALITLLVGTAVMLNQSAVHWRPNINDSHLYAYYGWQVALGAVPYADVWNNKPPGTWWLNALSFHLWGPGLEREIFVCSIALAISITAFAGIAATLYGSSLIWLALPAGCVLLADVVYECGGNRTETFVVMCETLAVFAYLRSVRSGSPAALLLAGIATGSAPWFKQTGLAALVACGLHLAWRLLRRREAPRAVLTSAGIFAGGALLVQMLAGGALLVQGVLDDAWFAIVMFNSAYFDAGWARWLPLDVIVGVWNYELRALRPLLVIAGAGVVLRVIRAVAAVRRRGAAEGVAMLGEAPVLWAWFVVAFYLGCVSSSRMPYHMMVILPSLGLLALDPLAVLVGRENLGRRIAARPSLAACVAVFLGFLGQAVHPQMLVFRHAHTQKPAWYALEREPPAAYERQARMVRALTRPEDEVYVWGWSPGTYRFAYRRCPSAYGTIEKVGQVGERARFILDGARRDIRSHAPAVFVVSVGDLHALRSATDDAFATWVCEQYVDLGEIDGMHILQLRR